MKLKQTDVLYRQLHGIMTWFKLTKAYRVWFVNFTRGQRPIFWTDFTLQRSRHQPDSYNIAVLHERTLTTAMAGEKLKFNNKNSNKQIRLKLIVNTIRIKQMKSLGGLHCQP